MKKGISPQNTFLDTIATKFDGTHSNFVLGNAQAHGCPIVYCSDGFCELSGYPRSQVMGRSCACKFLFGDDTTVDEKGKIEEALEEKTELKTEVFLYKKDGTQFKCLLDIVPIKNEKSQVVLILVSHKDIGPKHRADEVSDKSSSENDSDEEMAEAYRKCQARRGRAAGVPPGSSGYNNQRRRSRAVLYHLSGQFEKQNRAKRAKNKLQQLNKFSSISGKMPEYKVQEVKKSKFILVHYGIFKINWDWLILLCTFYTAVLVPFNAAFTRSDKKNQRDSIYSDVVVEILFMFDILFNFRTSFVNKRGQVVYQAHLIAMNYIRGWFLLDLLAAIPFDFLYIFNINADAPVHLLKVARLLRLARLLQKIDRFSQYSALVLALLMSMFTLLAHWLACIWYAIGHVEFEDMNASGWLSELSERLHLNPEEVIGNDSTNNTVAMVKPDVLMSYLSALYFTCSSLTSVGFGNVSANTYSEKIFSICAMIIGALMHAVVFGNVTALIQRMYQRRANFHSKTKDLKDFFRAYDIPKPLKQRMQEYFQTMWSMNNGIETNEILKDFPEEMKGELGLHLHKDILSLPIFEDATQGCLKSIALHTRRSFCAPGEVLVHKGDASNYLFLLVSGSMEILKMDMVVAILGKGDLFGSNIDFDEPISVCNFDVRSLTYSELQCISIKGLTDVLLLYPEFAEKFSKDIHNDLTYNLRHSFEDSDEDAESSPKPRVCTLPSISEDDEVTGSDEDGEEKDDKDNDDDDTILPSITTSTSPLLSSTKQLKIPNGDIESLEQISSPKTSRAWTAKRGHPQVSRGSLKEARKIRLGHHNDPVDKLLPHVQNLQNDIEGTKSAIAKLERRVGRIGQDISSIDRNMREILKHITNISKMNPLEPLAPASPVTPQPCHISAAARFHFDNVSHHSNESLKYDKDHDNEAEKEVVHKTGSSLEVPKVKPHHASKRRGGSVKIPKKHHYQTDSTPGDDLLNPYSAYQRRHSDGTHAALLECSEKITNSAKNKIPATTKQEYVFHPDTQNEETRLSLTPLLISHKRDPDEVIYDNNQDNVFEFKNMLTDVHSHECNVIGRQRSKTNEVVSRPASKRIRKSETCGNIECNFDKVKPKEESTVIFESKEIVVDPVIEVQRKSQELLPTFLQNEKLMALCAVPVKSASLHEMTGEIYHPTSNVTKSKSHDILETEFGALTPNEVRTFHVRSRPQAPLSAVDNIAALDGEPFGHKNERCQIQNNIKIYHGSPTDSSYSPDSYDSSKVYSVVPDQNKTDSGHVSLVDCSFMKPSNGTNTSVDIDLERTKIFLGDIAPKLHEERRATVRQNSLHMENEKSSPDSLSDISESLKTDSLTVDTSSPLNDSSQPDVQKTLHVDGHSLQTTDL